jgi:WD40 repeat protein
VWDHAHRSLVATLEGHSADIQGVWFLGSSYAVLVQSEDGVLRLWDGPSGEPLTTVYRGDDGAWLVVDSKGRFDTAGTLGGDLIAWLNPGDSRHLLPAAAFTRDFQVPGLLQRYLECESARQADPEACAKAFAVRSGP